MHVWTEKLLKQTGQRQLSQQTLLFKEQLVLCRFCRKMYLHRKKLPSETSLSVSRWENNPGKELPDVWAGENPSVESHLF